MIYVLLIVVVCAVVALGISAVIGYFRNEHTGKVKALKEELAVSNERVSIAQTALIEIASGAEMPILRASDALSEITRSYTKEINK